MSNKLTDKRMPAGAATSDDASQTITIKPGEQMRVALGRYKPTNHAHGFSIDLDPDPYPENSLETQIINTGTTKEEKMVLFIANYGTRPVTAVVRQL